MLSPKRWLMTLAVGVVVVVLGSPVQAQTASALLREGDELPGAPGETVSFINNPVVNHAGGYAVTVNTTGSGTTLGNIWGNASGGAGTVIVTERLYGDLQQTSFESFHGFSDAGVPAYSAISTNVVSGATGLDGAWLRRSRMRRGVELDQISSVTKISETHLRSIEEENFAELPARVYVRGFVTAYARCIGLDPAAVVPAYMERFSAARPTEGRRRQGRG